MARVGNHLFTRVYKAGQAIAANQLVKLSGGVLAIAPLQNSNVLGVTTEAIAEGDYGEVVLVGTAFVQTSGAIVAGQTVVTSAQGYALASTGNDADKVFGIALSAAAAAGEQVEVLLQAGSN